MRLKVTLSLLLVLSLLILGCGSSGNSGSSGSSGGTTGGGTTGSTSGGETTGGETTGGETTGGETTGGDTTGGETTSSAPLTKAAFIKKGEFICELVPTSYNEKLEALKKENKANGNKKTSKSEENLKAAVPPLRTAVEEFEALTPPKGSEKEVEAIIAALEAAADGVEEKPTSELSGPKSPFAEFQKLTGKFGLNRCTTL